MTPFGWYRITKQVRNRGSEHIEWVEAVGMVQHAHGAVIDCHFANVNRSHLNPGETGSLVTILSLRDDAAVACYRLQVDGWKR